MHVATSFVVTFVEPIVNTVMHHFFEAYWDHPRAMAARSWVAQRMAALRAPRMGGT
ncbi:MAG: DUF2061 domain-containing protein [Proteobacteria bacterium]|uniref:hypothetical protein n=1 Tax=Aquabacterium sp. TaxID=1872578 RepID=UPI0035C7299D|nr:DUF2061 domain-containing protein [Pseudomonadota bacterium]